MRDDDRREYRAMVSQRRNVSLVAAAATLLAAMPMSTIFASWTWLIDCVIAIAAVCGAAIGTRALRAPLVAQVAAMAAALTIVLTWLFPSGHEYIGIIPSGGTFRHFAAMVAQSGQQMRDESVPVPDLAPLLFLTTLGIGAVALFVDLTAVGLRRPALAGLPMLAIYSVPVAVRQDGVSFVPFMFGAFGFLWLLVTDNVDRVRRFGRRFTGEGRDVDLWEPSPLAGAGRRLGVISVVVAILVPALIPGMTGGLLSRFGTGTGGFGPGRGSAVNLFADFAGQLNQEKTVAMVKVQTNDPSPYYLRLATADQLTNTGFHSAAPAGGAAANGQIPQQDLPQLGNTTTYQATVTSVTLQMYYLPIYAQVTRISRLDGTWLYDPTDNVLYSNRENSRGRKYSFDFVHLTYTPAQLRTAQPLPADDPIQREETIVPAVPAVQSKVAQLTKGLTTPYDKVRAIYDYFAPSNGFAYALSTKSGTSGSDIVDFLNNKRGYCEQYAATMAWMVRAAGIPARVALGFARGTNKSGDTYTLTNRNLHAWTEVYLQGFGWVPFDPTPAASIAGSAPTAWAPDTTQPNSNGSSTTPEGGQVPNGSSSGASPTGPGGKKEVNHDGGSAAVVARKSNPWPWVALGVLLLVLLLAAAPAMRRAALRRRRTSGAGGPRARTVGNAPAAGGPSGDAPGGSARRPPADGTAVPAGHPLVLTTPMTAEPELRRQAHDAWDELLDTLIDYRVPLNDAETPRTMIDRVVRAAALPEPAAAGARLLGRAEERARYARTPVASDGLGGALRAVRAALRARVSTRTRLRAALLPPSVTIRWRANANGAVYTLTGAVGRLRDVTARVFTPGRVLRLRPR